MSNEPSVSATDMVARLNAIWRDDDHERGCKGREYECTCGFDQRTEDTAREAADLIEKQAAELAAITAEFETVSKERDEGLLCQQEIAAGSDRAAIVARIIISKNEALGRAEAAEVLMSAQEDAVARVLDLQQGGLELLRLAIEAGDPNPELLLRVDDLLHEAQSARVALSERREP